MSRFFKPYEGGRPFVFISYAHKQSDQVVDTIRILHEKGWRLWYDEGIPAGSDWPVNIAQHMQRCERVIFFLSKRALESPNCFSEIRTAARLNKPMLVVSLEETEPDESWRELLKDKEILPILAEPAARAEAILHSGFLPRRLHRSWTERVPWRVFGLAASLLFFLAAAGTMGALATGRINPVPQPTAPAETPAPAAKATAPPVLELDGAERFFAVGFPDTQQEKAIRRALGNPAEEVYRWQLAEIRELYFCGNLNPNGFAAVSFDRNGVCRVNGAPVTQGQVNDLSLIADMARLEKLALICQPLTSISGLNGLTQLRELSLAGSKVESLSTLKELPSLEVLHLEHTGVQDLTSLDAFPNLKTVTVSLEMLPLSWNEKAAFAVILIREA